MNVVAELRRFRSLELNPHYQRLFDAASGYIEQLEGRVAKLGKQLDLIMADARRYATASASADYEEVLADHRRLVRELDVLLNGEAGAAKQASLCDLVAQVARMKRTTDEGRSGSP
jgi:ATP:corrinoid adenosyltransferase